MLHVTTKSIGSNHETIWLVDLSQATEKLYYSRNIIKNIIVFLKLSELSSLHIK